jgi:hypothetical protein
MVAASGYKIVGADYSSFVGRPRLVYGVGETYRHADGPVRFGSRGLHFATDALDCLALMGWLSGWHLLRVEAPDGAVVVSGGGGAGTHRVTDVLHVVAEVPAAEYDALLSGVVRTGMTTTWYLGGQTHRQHGGGDDDEPAVVRRYGHHVTKLWRRRGVEYNGALGQFCKLSVGDADVVEAWSRLSGGCMSDRTVLTPSSSPQLWKDALALVTRRESFELGDTS